MPRLWVVVATKVVDLYKTGDTVDLGEGKRGTIKNVDAPNDMVELDVESTAPEGGMVGAKYKIPGEVKIPLKKV